MKSSSKGRNLIILGVILVVIDQVIKVLVKTNMQIGESIPVLGNWFQLVFVENKGMAFGMSFGGVAGKYLLTAFRIILFCVLSWWISRLAKRKNVPAGVLVGLTLITAGAFGNIVDCLFYGLIFTESAPGVVATLGSYAPFMQGRVVDMFYFPLWVWPDWVPWLGGHVFFEPVFILLSIIIIVKRFKPFIKLCIKFIHISIILIIKYVIVASILKS